MNIKRKTICFVLVILLFFSAAPKVYGAPIEEDAAAMSKDFWEQDRYSLYIEKYKDVSRSGEDIIVDGAVLTENSGAERLSDYNGNAGNFVKSDSAGYVEFTFTAPVDALYQMEFTYYTIAGNGQKIERSLTLDGAAPFQEAATISLDRVFRDKSPDKRDRNGNQIRSEQEEVLRRNTQFVEDSSGVQSQPLLFYVSAGEHKLRLESIREPVILESIRFCAPEEDIMYSDYIAKYKDSDYVADALPVKAQAESTFEKSDQSIYPTNDRSTASVEPYSVDEVRLNMLSGEKFRIPGQWVSYEVVTEKAGLYRISIKGRQSYKDGGFVSRQITVNYELPFSEAGNIKFKYSNRYKSYICGDEDNPYYFYFNAGRNIITMKAVVGDLSEMLSRTQEVVDTLNTVYRKIFMITGPVPDQFRDYHFSKAIPGEIEALDEMSAELDRLVTMVTDITGETGSYLAVFQNIKLDLDQMVANPESIAKRMQNFKVNLGSLSDWVVTEQMQPLDMDYFELLSKDSQPQKAAAGFFEDLWHQIRLFFSSFFMSYNRFDSNDEVANNIDVWVITGGLDQTQLVKQLIDDSFTPEHKIGVKLQLVPSALLSSTLAGIGPDVALFVGNNEPMNYAVRGAAMDLTRFSDFNDVAERFEPEALIPYTFHGGTYALPETMTWPMMFYRKDILKELNIPIPENWEQIYDTIIKLQDKNLSFAMPVDISGYYMFLNQLGGTLFKDDGASVNIDTIEGISAFNQWTEYFSSYKLDVEYNFVNRFRTGEMPVGIADFTMGNQLKVFAPEIRGMWEMVPVPATVREDGSSDRSTICTGSANMMLAQTKKADAAFEYMKWWSSAKTQSSYAKQLESILGLAARYATANKEAFIEQAWTVSELKNLTGQRALAKAIPEVPGSYIVPRYIDFAFKAVVNDSADPGKEILNYSKIINAELTRKRQEFAEVLKD